jgi:hypothetical protein
LRLRAPLWLLPLTVIGCGNHHQEQPGQSTALTALPELPACTAAATPRINGYIGTPQAGGAAHLSYGSAVGASQPVGFAATTPAGGGLPEFSDTDIREVAARILGEPDARNSLVDFVRAFDVDSLAGQSYALLPVTSGGADDFATQMQDALHTEGSSALAGQVHVVPLDRVDAVLVVASRPGFIDDVRRIVGTGASPSAGVEGIGSTGPGPCRGRPVSAARPA